MRLNYISREKELRKTFLNVKKSLGPDGIFIFDLNTEFGLSCKRKTVHFYKGSDYYLVWQTKHNLHSKTYRTILTFLLKNNKHYQKCEEIHLQKAYGFRKIGKLLKDAGFTKVHTFNCLSFKPPSSRSQKIFYAAF